MAMELFDLRKKLVFYCSYHSNQVNIAIHLACIWNIVWSGFALLHFITPFAHSPEVFNLVPFLKDIPIGMCLHSIIKYLIE